MTHEVSCKPINIPHWCDVNEMQDRKNRLKARSIKNLSPNDIVCHRGPAEPNRGFVPSPYPVTFGRSYAGVFRSNIISACGLFQLNERSRIRREISTDDSKWTQEATEKGSLDQTGKGVDQSLNGAM